MPQCTAMRTAAINVCVVMNTSMPTYPALVYLTTHSRPTKPCCCVCKMQCEVELPQKIMLHTAPRDVASATALVATIKIHTKQLNEYDFINVPRIGTHAEERHATQCRCWCATTMVVRWTARSRTLQRCHQSLNQIVHTYTHTVHYTLHNTSHHYSPPHHQIVLL